LTLPDGRCIYPFMKHNLNPSYISHIFFMIIVLFFIWYFSLIKSLSSLTEMYFVWFVVHVLLPSSHLHVILFLLTMGSDIISHRVAIWLFYIKTNPSAVNYIFCKTFNSLGVLYLLVRYCRYFVLESYHFFHGNVINI
jgi:hypothetical protein